MVHVYIDLPDAGNSSNAWVVFNNGRVNNNNVNNNNYGVRPVMTLSKSSIQ